jgi:hypothetical protein
MGFAEPQARHTKGKKTLIFMIEHIIIFGLLNVTTEGEI